MVEQTQEQTAAGRVPERSRPALAGNRLVLGGSVLYLLEWVAIVAAPVQAPVGAAASRAALDASYVGHVNGLGWAAGWFGVVLVGRILLVAGLRSAMTESGRPQRLMDVAVGAMTVSVALEVAVYAVVSGAAWSLARGGSADVARGLDAVAFQLDQTLYGALGIAVLCAGVAMWHSGLFGRVLSGLGTAAGVAFVVVGAAFVAPRFSGAAGALSAAALVFWIWMLWAGVVVWRGRRPHSSR